MLDSDHRQFFTLTSLRELLETTFKRCEVIQSHPVDGMIADLVLPRPLPLLYRGLARVGAAPPRYFSRLLGQGWVTGRAYR
jgi:hypothetical protein